MISRAEITLNHEKTQVVSSAKVVQMENKNSKLVAACIQHDRKAQEQLYDTYKVAMYTILVRMLNDEADAADALQDAFIQIFKNLKRFEGKSTLGAWIKTIVVRTGIAKLKKQTRVIELETSIHKADSEVIVWDENLTGEYLAKAIQQLPNGYRTVFLLIEVEGYSHKEVSNLVGISEGTSKSQLFKAKKMLKTLLKDIK